MGKKTRFPRARPTPDKLRELSEHVAYEVEMLIGTATRLVGPRTQDRIDACAQAESFLIHARQLFDFFYCAPKLISLWQAPPVCAEDYVADWETRRPPQPPVLTTLKRDVGRRVAHLTVERVVGQQYPVLDAARALLEVICRFRDAKPPDFVSDLGDLAPFWAQRPGFVFSGVPVFSTSSKPEVFIVSDVGAPVAAAKADVPAPGVSGGGKTS